MLKLVWRRKKIPVEFKGTPFTISLLMVVIFPIFCVASITGDNSPHVFKTQMVCLIRQEVIWELYLCSLTPVRTNILIVRSEYILIFMKSRFYVLVLILAISDA